MPQPRWSSAGGGRSAKACCRAEDPEHCCAGGAQRYQAVPNADV